MKRGLQAQLVLVFFTRSAKTAAFCVSSFILWWTSVHNNLDGGHEITGDPTQRGQNSFWQPPTGPCQVLQSSNKHAKSTLLHFMHIPVGLWSRSASLRCSAPPAAAMETRSSTRFSRADSSGRWIFSHDSGSVSRIMHVQSGSAVTPTALHLQSVKELNRYNPQLLPSFRKRTFKWLRMPTSHSYQANLLHSKRFIRYRGERS